MTAAGPVPTDLIRSWIEFRPDLPSIQADTYRYVLQPAHLRVCRLSLHMRQPAPSRDRSTGQVFDTMHPPQMP